MTSRNEKIRTCGRSVKALVAERERLAKVVGSKLPDVQLFVRRKREKTYNQRPNPYQRFGESSELTLTQNLNCLTDYRPVDWAAGSFVSYIFLWTTNLNN